MTLRFIQIIIAATLVLQVGTKILAQDSSWQRIAPVGESFTLLLPAKAFEVTRLIPLNGKDWAPARVYYSLVPGRRYLVLSLVKTSANKVPALSSFDNYVKAMESAFKNSGTEDRSLTLDSDFSDQSGVVRQYQVKLGAYSGVARFIGSDDNFYALMLIGADKNDADAQRFFSSFAMSKINADARSSGVILNFQNDTAAFERTQNSSPPEPWPKANAPITGGVLNGKALSLPKPSYPKAARKAHDSGLVIVHVIIDERGYVIWAEASDGPLSLRAACVEAAWMARFTPTKLAGQPVKVTGVIAYTFIAP